MNAILLHRSWPESYAYLPIAFDRITKFCTKYNDDSPPEVLCETLLTEFAKNAPGTIVVLGLRPDGSVCGHALVALEMWLSGKMATVLQMESDEPLKRTEMEAAFSVICKWAEDNGAKELQIFARDHRLERVFRRFYGFETKRIFMKRPFGSIAGSN